MFICWRCASFSDVEILFADVDFLFVDVEILFADVDFLFVDVEILFAGEDFLFADVDPFFAVLIRRQRFWPLLSSYNHCRILIRRLRRQIRILRRQIRSLCMIHTSADEKSTSVFK